jgi:RNA polymerase sigma factor (sigma-70 family)
VAAVTKRLGLRHIDLAEDVAQSALSQAIKHWSRKGIPDNPGGWLYRVATRLAIDTLRRETVLSRKLLELQAEGIDASTSPLEIERLDLESGYVEDDQLQLLFACCSPELPAPSSIALALKVLCGFGVPEIARALLTSPANAQKKITRAKEKLQKASSLIPERDFQERANASSMVLYLLFNEGYLASHNELSIRRDLCFEAKRLALLIASHPRGQLPSVFSLLALMCFHMARMPARADADGEVLLLDSQDRSTWNWKEIREGMDWLQHSASGTEVSRFHIEASIAWEHCRAAKFEETDWEKIRSLYDLLLRKVASPAQVLNRAIAEFYCSGPKSALQLVGQIPDSQHPKDYPIWNAVLGFLHHRDGNLEQAKKHWLEALACTHSRAEQELLRRRIESCR